MEFAIKDYVDLYYILTTTMLTYLILLVIINTSKRGVKIAVSLFSGILIGLIFYYVKLTTVNVLITSFFASIVLYEWLIKKILDVFNINTNNDTGIKL